MSKIIKLDKNLANQIAAWEVVERPISVIKELVENSIDAWANNIKIEITNWGIDYISISDNWSGIEKDDIELVVEKYSTSKIKNLDDLYNVMTFWFRWEAMSSISSVSKMIIITKSKNDDFWSLLKINAWEKENITDFASEIWTKIVVENLFFNTPARLNYLKKPRTEYNHILTYLNEVSLSYPSIWFEFISDNKQIFKYRDGDNLKTRIYNVYWSEFSENLLEIDFNMVWISVKWYISDPKVSFSNKNKQCLFVNNRPIKSYLIAKSINDAYNRFIPHSTNSWYIINLIIDPTQVDVNVHPRKLEVRFANEQNIFRAVYHSIQEKLESVSLITSSNINDNINIDYSTAQKNNEWTKINSFYTWSWTKFKSYSPYKDTTPNPKQWQIENALNFSVWLLDKVTLNNECPTFEKTNDLHHTPLWKIIWQSHNSYIIVETVSWIKFLDQHALAERVIYEKLIKADKKISIQWLLLSESFNIMPNEANILNDNIDTFFEMWFDIELMPWNIVIINWIPEFIKKENLQNIFLWILEDIWNWNFNKSNTLEEVKNKIYAYTSCRSAIKFWHKLSLFEMNKLLNDSVVDYSATCPHWRPVVFDINLSELKDKYER